LVNDKNAKEKAANRIVPEWSIALGSGPLWRSALIVVKEKGKKKGILSGSVAKVILLDGRRLLTSSLAPDRRNSFAG